MHDHHGLEVLFGDWFSGTAAVEPATVGTDDLGTGVGDFGGGGAGALKN
jgi:hypothetical protein